MHSQIESYIADKNSWLSKQVDVAFPTPESLIGRELYLKSQQNIKYNESEVGTLLKAKETYDIVEVDFHRLTILFSILQASQWESNQENERLIIEFLTQIILDDEYQLYLGFMDNEPTAALICKVYPDSQLMVLSDIVIAKKGHNSLKKQDFASNVLHYLAVNLLGIHKVIHPAWD